MATGETGFDDVTYDLISVQYHSLKAGHDYGQYVRDAKNAGMEEIASFFSEVMAQDSSGRGAATSSSANCRGRPRPARPQDKNHREPPRPPAELIPEPGQPEQGPDRRLR